MRSNMLTLTIDLTEQTTDDLILSLETIIERLRESYTAGPGWEVSEETITAAEYWSALAV